MHARTRRCPLSRGRAHPGCARQLIDPLGRRPVPSSPARRSPAYFATAEFHYTPKHASWLNMAEIEIGVLRSQCLDRRIDSREQVESEIAAWERQRNTSAARIKWMFTTDKTRAKFVGVAGVDKAGSFRSV